MRVRLFQPPYYHQPRRAGESVRWLISQLLECTGEEDLILLPELSNASADFPENEIYPCIFENTQPLLDACAATAKRCHALLFVNGAFEWEGSFRNTTLCYDRNGQVIGRYFKQHLPYAETHVNHLDDGYTFEYESPYILETEGLRFAFLTCYDFYFYEMFSHIAIQRPDVIIGCSHQRSDPHSILEVMGRFLSYNTNAYLLRSSVSMGPEEKVGGCTMAVGPDGNMIGNLYSRIGCLTADIDPHKKYLKPAGYRNPPAHHWTYVEKGRTPWRYRPAGSAISPCDAVLPGPRICFWPPSGLSFAQKLAQYAAAAALGAQELCVELDAADPQVFPHLEKLLKKLSCHAIFNLRMDGDWTREGLEALKKLLHKYDMDAHVYFSGALGEASGSKRPDATVIRTLDPLVSGEELC